MDSFVVACPNCTQPARVPTEARGLYIACPRCELQYRAVPPGDIPLVHPIRKAPIHDEEVHHEEPHHTPHHHHSPAGILAAVALLPMGIPLLWLIVGLTTKIESVFSYAAPVSIAVSVCGLCGGLAFTQRWSVAARLRAMGVLVLLAYAIAALLFFTKPNWIEQIRKVFNPGLIGREFKDPDRIFAVRFPNEPEEAASPLAEWRLTAYKAIDSETREVFIAAQGRPPLDFPTTDLAEDLYFDKAREALLKTSGGKLLKESPITSGVGTVREYELQMPDAKRIVRVIKVKTKVYYLSVEGPFLTPETPIVRDFMKSFKLLKKN